MRTPVPATISGCPCTQELEPRYLGWHGCYPERLDSSETCDGILARRWTPVFWLQPHAIDIVAQEAVVGVQPGQCACVALRHRSVLQRRENLTGTGLCTRGRHRSPNAFREGLLDVLPRGTWRAMADSTLLAPELSDAESMGEETVRFQELLLKASKELQQAQTARPESTQIQPKPGFCIKTNSSEGKVFINICHSPSIPPPVDVTEEELLQMLEEDQAAFRIPMSLGEPHAELDAKGQGCTAYDVAVNSNFYLRMQNSDFLRELVVTIAREGLEDKYGLQLNPEWRMLKYRSFLGSISQQNIRSQQRPRIQELGTLDASDSMGTRHGPERPRLNLWLEAPDLLLAEVDLPKLDGAQGLALEIGENRLVIGGPQQLYHLDASIPLRINSEASRAAFHHRRKQLMVSMPLLAASS